jgi:probable selenium-dependent hydroxylase accessory protein YqeC
MLIDDIVLHRLINHPNGMFKNTPNRAIRIWIINALDLALSESLLITLSQKLLDKNPQLQAIWLLQAQHKMHILRRLIKKELIQYNYNFSKNN